MKRIFIIILIASFAVLFTGAYYVIHRVPSMYNILFPVYLVLLSFAVGIRIFFIKDESKVILKKKIAKSS